MVEVPFFVFVCIDHLYEHMRLQAEALTGNKPPLQLLTRDCFILVPITCLYHTFEKLILLHQSTSLLKVYQPSLLNITQVSGPL